MYSQKQDISFELPPAVVVGAAVGVVAVAVVVIVVAVVAILVLVAVVVVVERLVMTAILTK